MPVRAVCLASILISASFVEIQYRAASAEVKYFHETLQNHDGFKLSKEVEKSIAEVTVKVVSNSEGSGVIFEKISDTDIYLVYTAWHNIKSVGQDEEIEIITHDGKSHYAKGSDVKKIAGDSAYIYFESKTIYPKAGDDSISRKNEAKNIQNGDQVLVSGFPKSESNLTISTGSLLSKSIEYDNSGYGLNYTNSTTSGMSGGGIFTLQGQLFGIHGQASQDVRASEVSGARMKSGVSVGMPLFVAEPREWEVWGETSKHEARNLIRFLETVLEKNPSKDVFIKLGNLYYNIEHFSTAEKYYTSAIKYKNDMPEWEFEAILDLRALTRIKQNKLESARADLNELIALQESAGKSSIDSMILLIRTLPYDDRLAQLESWVKRHGAQKLSTIGFLMWSNLYKSLINSNNTKKDNEIYTEKSIKYIKEALAKCRRDLLRKNAEVDSVIACSYVEIPYATQIAGVDLKSYREALSIINKFIKADPSNPDLYVKRSSIHLSGGHFAGKDNPFIDDLTKATSIDRYHVEANYWFNFYGYHAYKMEYNLHGMYNEFCQDMIDFQTVLDVEGGQDERIDTFIENNCLNK